jgi:glycosyltransferase involved in cell wall biosynthesis
MGCAHSRMAAINETFPGRLGLQQRVLPSYRVPFFDMLASACEGGMSLFAGQPRAEESIVSGKLQVAKYAPAKNVHLFRGLLYFCYQRGLLDWLNDWKPDALIVEANPRYLSTPAAVKWMQVRERPVIGWGLGAPPSSSPHFLRKWGERKRGAFLNRFDALIAYSQRGADEYAAYGFPREKIFVAYNAVSPVPAALPDRRSFDDAQDKPTTVDRGTILFVGRLQARKRVDSLLRACAEMPDPKPGLIIVGDGLERERLEALARQVYPPAEFIGTKHGDELKPYFAEADLFVLPGTGGLAVQEAMSHGLPIIVAKGDGTQDDLVRPENGWQIPPGDDDALASAIREALSDISRLRKMGDESYRIVSQEINLEKMVEVFLGALNSVS